MQVTLEDQKTFSYIENQLSCFSFENQEIIRDFLLDNHNLSASNLLNYVSSLKSFLKVIKKSLLEVTEDDARAWEKSLIKQGREKTTINGYGVRLKRFFRWLDNSVFEWWKPYVTKPQRKDMLIPKENIRKILDGVDNLKVKAMLSVLYEGALRSKEIRYLRIRDVIFEREIAILMVSGKTGERTIPVINSSPLLHLWLLNHPFRDDQEALVFPTRSWDPNPYSRQSFDNLIKRICIRIGVPKVSAHMFRHTRLTELATLMTESELRVFAGWQPDSAMVRIYVHLSGRDAKKAIFKIYGLEEDKRELDQVFKPEICPRCKTSNPSGAKACYFCTLILDDELAFEELKKRQERESKLEQEISNLKRKQEEMIDIVSAMRRVIYPD